jgi:putative DeoR family transcriptional regulator (stage III sporulation protein D)
MKQDMEERAAALAQYIIEHRATVRMAAKEFGFSKSTVHAEIIKENGFGGG